MHAFEAVTFFWQYVHLGRARLCRCVRAVRVTPVVAAVRLGSGARRHRAAEHDPKRGCSAPPSPTARVGGSLVSYGFLAYLHVLYPDHPPDALLQCQLRDDLGRAGKTPTRPVLSASCNWPNTSLTPRSSIAIPTTHSNN